MKHVRELDKETILEWYDSLGSLTARTKRNMLEAARTWMLSQKLEWEINLSEAGLGT